MKSSSHLSVASQQRELAAYKTVGFFFLNFTSTMHVTLNCVYLQNKERAGATQGNHDFFAMKTNREKG